MANSHIGKGFSDTRSHYRGRRRRTEYTVDSQRDRRQGLGLSTAIHVTGTCRACGGSFEGPDLIMDGEGGHLCLGCESDLQVGAVTKASIWRSVGIGVAMGLLPGVLGVSLAIGNLIVWSQGDGLSAACSVLMVAALVGAWSVLGAGWGLSTARSAPSLDERSDLVEVRPWERLVVLLTGFCTTLGAGLGLLGSVVSLILGFLG